MGNLRLTGGPKRSVIGKGEVATRKSLGGCLRCWPMIGMFNLFNVGVIRVLSSKSFCNK